MPEVAATALGYAMQHGWAVFRLAEGAKLPERGSHGHLDATSDPAAVEAMFADGACNVGLATGEPSDVFVVEIDTKAGHDVDGPASFRTLLDELGPLPTTYTVKSPTGSIHLYFAMPDNMAIRNRTGAGALAPGVEVKGTGGYVVAPPSETSKGAYVVARQAPVAQCPEAWLERIGQQLVKASPQDDDGEPIAAGDQEAAIAERAWRFVRAGMTDDEVAAALWAFMQSRCPNQRGRRPWTQQDAQDKASRAVKRWREGQSDLADLPNLPPLKPRTDQAPRQRDDGLFPIRTLDDMLALEPAAYLLEPYLVEGVNMLVGEPGSLKTFLALAWAAQIDGPVVYVCREGVGALGHRLAAWCKHHEGESVSEGRNVVFITADVQLPGDLERLLASIAAVSPALVVVDTLTDTSTSLDENSPDMRQVYNAMRTVQLAFGCGVLTLVHTGWEGKRERGHSSIRGMADITMLIEKNESGVARLKCLKVRDASEFMPAYLRLDDGGGLAQTAWLVQATREDFDAKPDDDAAAGEMVAVLWAAFGSREFATKDCDGLDGVNRTAWYGGLNRRSRLSKLSELGHVRQQPNGAWQLTPEACDWMGR